MMTTSAMLADTLLRVPRSEGLQLLQRRGERGARELTSHRLRLSAGGSARWSVPDEETVVVLHEGRGTASVAGRTWSVGRTGVFTERATALLLPPGLEMTVTADTLLEAVLISTPASPGGESVTHEIRDGDAVLLPYGYHPVCSPPGYALYYLWALAGDQRRLALFEDPAHSWIHDAKSG